MRPRVKWGQDDQRPPQPHPVELAILLAVFFGLAIAAGAIAAYAAP